MRGPRSGAARPGSETHRDGPIPGRFEQLFHLNPRILIAALLCSVVMIPVGLVLSVLGVFVLKLAGGADTDTGLVVFVAAIAVSDFWGGGATWALTKAARRDVTISWGIARIPALVVSALISTRLAIVAPIELLLALPAAWLGVSMAHTQSRLRAVARRHEARLRARDDAK